MGADSRMLREHVEVVCASYRAGQSQDAIAKSLRVAKARVSEIVRDHISAAERVELRNAHRSVGYKRRVIRIQKEKVANGAFSIERRGDELVATTNGVSFRFDADAEPLLMRYPWRVSSDGRRLARQVGTEDRKNIYVYHDLLGVTPSRQLVVDHINRDPTDNRRINLRLCTPSENALNREPRNGDPTDVRRF